MDINFYDLYKIPDYKLEEIKSIACAAYLYTQNKNVALDRLCQLGGFLIRNVDFDWDVQTYKRELSDKRIVYKKECKIIHNFVLRHISEYSKKMYFKTDLF